MEKKIHYVDWKEMQSLEGKLFETGFHHEIRVIRETIPIIFVPGIMGTNLQGSKGLVWFPSNPGWMKDNYAKATPKDRKTRLIDDEHVDVLRFGQVTYADNFFLTAARKSIFNGKEPFFDWLPHPELGNVQITADEDWKAFAAKQVARMGWSEISADSYLDYLVRLSQPASFGPYLRYFILPVYAFGYNWIRDNAIAGKLLMERIEAIIKVENAKPKHYCTRVIVVTHSMGGIVSRTAMQQGAKCLMLGAVHGAQPVTGAPAAYRRMRAGFENIHPHNPRHPWDDILNHFGSLALGPSAEHVVPILGNAVGGLELFPTHQYKDNTGNPQWLAELDATGKLIGEPLPKNDAYGEIYKRQGTFLELVPNPSQLDPAGTSESKNKPGLPDSSTKDPFKRFSENVDKAADFHKTLGLFQHDKEKTYVMFSGGLESYHQIRYRYQRDHDATETVTGGQFSPAMQIPLGDAATGQGTDLDPYYRTEHKGAYFTIDDPGKQSGDGTVPISSATILEAADTFEAPPVGHQDFYKNEQVREASTTFIMKLLDDYLGEQVPGARASARPKK